MAFNFNPEDGLLNTDEFPDKPASGTVARNQFMRLFNQIKEYINGMETNGVKANGGNADTVGNVSNTEFSRTSHNHDTIYAKSSHTHNYSSSSHNHDSAYANVSHGHTWVESSSNTNKIKDKHIFVQQTQPTPEKVGDVWISW